MECGSRWIIYFLISVLLQLVEVKYGFAMPIGLDHRCVQGILAQGSSGSSFSNTTDTSNLQFVVTHLPCTGFFSLVHQRVFWILFNLFRL